MSQYVHLSWEQFSEDTHGLGRKLQSLNKKWDTIVAIARGGLVPAAIMAHVFPVRKIETICINSYDDDTFKQHELEVLKAFRSHDENILVIDDLVDKGHTFQLVREMLPNAHLACVYGKVPGIQIADTYYKEYASSDWLVFPWEPAVENESPEIKAMTL